MKALTFVLLMFPFLSIYAGETNGRTEFKVYGSCGMCKSRIENAAMTEGVRSADWSMENNILTLNYDPEITDLSTVHEKIAESGHDTEKVSADDSVYNNLPACCQYKREMTSFKVYGSCGMCKSRIEKAAMTEGVRSAEWSMEKNLLTLNYDPETTDLETVHEKIAEAGHDTEKLSADDSVYNSLPACCHYERKE